MRIGIDARSILNPDRKGGVGVGHYAYQLLRNLKQIDKENEYVIFFDSTVRSKDIEKFKGDNFSVRFFPYQKYGKFLPGIYKDIMLSGFLNREKLDLLHVIGFGNTLPPKFSGKIVVTTRGLGSLKYPDLYSVKTIKATKAIKKSVLENLNKLYMITSSQDLKDDAEKLLSIPEGRITIIHEGMDRRLCSFVSDEEVERIKKKYNMGNHGILYMGTIEPAKNIGRLMQAYKRLREKTGYYYKLIIAGKDGWMAQELKSMANDLGIAENVVFTGYLPPEDLSALFKAARAFVFIPICEGFGSPVIEAMACKLPVVASNIKSLREISGNAAVFADPHDTEGIVDAMMKVLKNEDIGKDLKENGDKQIGNFCWEKCARETLEVYKKVYKT